MLCIIRTKACKRCGGDLSLECDIYGTYIECIQCGAASYQEDMPSAIPLIEAKLHKVSKYKPIPVTHIRR